MSAPVAFVPARSVLPIRRTEFSPFDCQSWNGMKSVLWAGRFDYGY
jgi:hypothetical protein